MLGFLASAAQFVRLRVCVPLPVVLFLVANRAAGAVIVVRALNLITVVVPPALPAMLSIGTSFAIGRVRNRGVFCISPKRVNIAGKVTVEISNTPSKSSLVACLRALAEPVSRPTPYAAHLERASAARERDLDAR